jgi:TolB-like protein
MKKILCCMFALFVCVGLFAQQPIVAVAPFDAISGISAADANMITRVFFIRLGNTNKVSLVDRSVVERVLKEHSFQAGDWSNQQKTAELGKAFNADWIVRGELEKFGTNILVTVQFYDIQTFRFMGGADLRLANADAAYDNMDPLVNKLIETIAAVPVRHPLFGFWDSFGYIENDASAVGKIEFKGDGTFICAEWTRVIEHIVPNTGRGSAGIRWDKTVFSLAGSGTYTYTDGFLTLKYTLSGSRTIERLNTVSREMETVSRDNNHSEQGSCTVSYSISTDGKTLRVGNAPFFEFYRGTGSSSNQPGSYYYSEFSKR